MNFKTADLQAYAIAGSQDCSKQELIPFLQAALDAGITAFQLREKNPTCPLNSAERFQLAQQCRTLTQAYEVPLIIDDDVDLALAVGADGVHVGQKDTRIEQVLAQAKQRLFVGYSCETIAQVQKANSLQGIAYLGCGAVFPTVSKQDATDMGLQQLKKLATVSNYPIVAIGGITLANMSQVLDAGALGISGITLFTKSPNLKATLKQIKTYYPKE